MNDFGAYLLKKHGKVRTFPAGEGDVTLEKLGYYTGRHAHTWKRVVVFVISKGDELT